MDAMTDDDRKAIGDRVRAARVAAGYQQRDALAREVKLPRFGAKTIGAVERGQRPLYEHEAVELARVLDVGADWFFQTQAGQSQLDRIEANQEEILRLLRLAVVTAPSGVEPLRREELGLPTESDERAPDRRRRAS